MESEENECAFCGEQIEGNGRIVPPEAHSVKHWRDLVAEAMTCDSGSRVCDYCWSYGEEIAKRWFNEGVGR